MKPETLRQPQSKIPGLQQPESELPEAAGALIVGSMFQQPSFTVIAADGSVYQTIDDTVHDGNCGLQAVKAATGHSGEILELRTNLVDAVILFSIVVHSIHDRTFQDHAKESDVKEFFNNDFSRCKSYLLHALRGNLKASDLTTEVRCALEHSMQTVESAEDFDSSVVAIFLNTFPPIDFTMEAAQGDLIETISTDKNWLTSDQVIVLMLRQGFILEDKGFVGREAIHSDATHTVMRFRNLSNPEDVVYIANNAKPGRYLGGSEVVGTHWVAVVPMAVTVQSLSGNLVHDRDAKLGDVPDADQGQQICDSNTSTKIAASRLRVRNDVVSSRTAASRFRIGNDVQAVRATKKVGFVEGGTSYIAVRGSMPYHSDESPQSSAFDGVRRAAMAEVRADSVLETNLDMVSYNVFADEVLKSIQNFRVGFVFADPMEPGFKFPENFDVVIYEGGAYHKHATTGKIQKLEFGATVTDPKTNAATHRANLSKDSVRGKDGRIGKIVLPKDGAKVQKSAWVDRLRGYDYFNQSKFDKMADEVTFGEILDSLNVPTPKHGLKKTKEFFDGLPFHVRKKHGIYTTEEKLAATAYATYMQVDPGRKAEFTVGEVPTPKVLEVQDTALRPDADGVYKISGNGRNRSTRYYQVLNKNVTELRKGPTATSAMYDELKQNNYKVDLMRTFFSNYVLPPELTNFSKYHDLVICGDDLYYRDTKGKIQLFKRSTLPNALNGRLDTETLETYFKKWKISDLEDKLNISVDGMQFRILREQIQQDLVILGIESKIKAAKKSLGDGSITTEEFGVKIDAAYDEFLNKYPWFERDKVKIIHGANRTTSKSSLIDKVLQKNCGTTSKNTRKEIIKVTLEILDDIAKIEKALKIEYNSRIELLESLTESTSVRIKKPVAYATAEKAIVEAGTGSKHTKEVLLPAIDALEEVVLSAEQQEQIDQKRVSAEKMKKIAYKVYQQKLNNAQQQMNVRLCSEYLKLTGTDIEPKNAEILITFEKVLDAEERKIAEEESKKHALMSGKKITQIRRMTSETSAEVSSNSAAKVRQTALLSALRAEVLKSRLDEAMKAMINEVVGSGVSIADDEIRQIVESSLAATISDTDNDLVRVDQQLAVTKEIYDKLAQKFGDADVDSKFLPDTVRVLYDIQDEYKKIVYQLEPVIKELSEELDEKKSPLRKNLSENQSKKENLEKELAQYNQLQKHITKDGVEELRLCNSMLSETMDEKDADLVKSHKKMVQELVRADIEQLEKNRARALESEKNVIREIETANNELSGAQEVLVKRITAVIEKYKADIHAVAHKYIAAIESVISGCSGEDVIAQLNVMKNKMLTVRYLEEIDTLQQSAEKLDCLIESKHELNINLKSVSEQLDKLYFSVDEVKRAYEIKQEMNEVEKEEPNDTTAIEQVTKKYYEQITKIVASIKARGISATEKTVVKQLEIVENIMKQIEGEKAKYLQSLLAKRASLSSIPQPGESKSALDAMLEKKAKQFDLKGYKAFFTWTGSALPTRLVRIIYNYVAAMMKISRELRVNTP